MLHFDAGVTIQGQPRSLSYLRKGARVEPRYMICAIGKRLPFKNILQNRVQIPGIWRREQKAPAFSEHKGRIFHQCPWIPDVLDNLSHHNEIENLVQGSLGDVGANDVIAAFSQIAYTVFKDIDPQATACGATHMLMQPFASSAGFGKMLYDPYVQNFLAACLLSNVPTPVIDQGG